jgi:aspartate carbamoyltransferase catalytic subunit
MHLISSNQFSTLRQLNEFFYQVELFKGLERGGTWPHFKFEANACEGKIMAALFFEPSLRTRCSFEAAMHRLGGDVITTSKQDSSDGKGETLEDAITTVSEYADVIVLRHAQNGAAERAAKITRIPVINAGDGSGEHPTQALLDVYTIKKRRSPADLTICVCGDLHHGRTVHSLCKLLSLYKNVRIIQACDPTLALPGALVEFLENKDVKVCFCDSLSKAIAEKPDVLYMTRLQRERIPDQKQNSFNWDRYCLTKDNISELPEYTFVMHPGPRNSEIATELDNDPRCIFRKEQVRNGLLVRMALLYSIFRNKVCYGPI